MKVKTKGGKGLSLAEIFDEVFHYNETQESSLGSEYVTVQQLAEVFLLLKIANEGIGSKRGECICDPRSPFIREGCKADIHKQSGEALPPTKRRNDVLKRRRTDSHD